jgi:phosphatidate cytidylyltransferase
VSRASAPSRRPRSRRSSGSEFWARVGWAVPAVAFAIFIVYSGGEIFAAGVFALGAVCLHELFRMYDRVRPVRLAGFVALAGLVVAALYGDERQVLLAAVASIPLVFLLGLAMPDPQRLTASMSITLLGVFWIGLAVAHAVLLSKLVLDGPGRVGDDLIVDILVGTFIGDTGAYLGGRLLGRRRLAPQISPNKTVEGLVIGMVAAVLATWFAGLYQDWLGGWEALALGVAVALAAPVGDLFESKVKRDAGTKDAGTLFGAHGGALDRLDAALFTLVAGYYVAVAIL